MNSKKKRAIGATFTFLLLSVAIPALMSNNASANQTNYPSDVDVGLLDDGSWLRINTSLITILFPADGKKPMFLWWYSNDTNNIYVVKYKGLVEYTTIDFPYYLHKYQADAVKIQDELEAKYVGNGLHLEGKKQMILDRIRMYIQLKSLFFNPALLPFSACQWNLTGPTNVTRPDGVSYISFNFTLEKAPPRFSFAENNVIIRARFYATDANETSYGLYNYTVHAGELKMDFVVNHWDWNIDRLSELFENLQDLGLSVPKMRSGLALWTDLASINVTDVPIAEADANSASDLVESVSQTSDIIVGGQRVRVNENRVAMNDDETPIMNGLRERVRLQFAKGSQTLAGFFDFVGKAVVTNSTSGEPSLVNVTAAYISAGAHMRLFIGYPYFGNNTLKHDPSIGVEGTVAWLPINLLMILIGATVLVAVAISAVKLRKKIVNIVTLQ